MMILRRGEILVLGLTDENLADLQAGKLLRARSDKTKLVDDVTVFILHGKDYAALRDELRTHGHNVAEQEPASGDNGGSSRPHSELGEPNGG